MNQLYKTKRTHVYTAFIVFRLCFDEHLKIDAMSNGLLTAPPERIDMCVFYTFFFLIRLFYRTSPSSPCLLSGRGFLIFLCDFSLFYFYSTRNSSSWAQHILCIWEYFAQHSPIFTIIPQYSCLWPPFIFGIRFSPYHM